MQRRKGSAQSGGVDAEKEFGGDAFLLFLQDGDGAQLRPGAFLFPSRQPGFVLPVFLGLVEPPLRVGRTVRPVHGLGQQEGGSDGSGEVDEDAVKGDGPVQQQHDVGRGVLSFLRDGHAISFGRRGRVSPEQPFPAIFAGLYRWGPRGAFTGNG